MNRRQFAVLGFASMLAPFVGMYLALLGYSWRKRPVPQVGVVGMKQHDTVVMVADRLKLPAGTTVGGAVISGLDPLLLAAMARLFMEVLRMCLMSQITRQQAAVRRRPDGRVAKAIKESLRKQFMEKYAGQSIVDVEAHCEQAVREFASATYDELVKVREDANEIRDEVNFDAWSLQDAVTVMVMVGEEG